MHGTRHTRYGWWLEEAGPIEATAPLEGDTTADVVVVGGGYLGLWTAWQLKSLEPDVDVVVLEAGLAGHGPSGRNGGFVSTLWDDLPILRDRVGDRAALEVARASERGVRGIGEWCEREGVDAWYRAAPTLYVATSESQLESPDEAIEACVELGVREEVRPITASNTWFCPVLRSVRVPAAGEGKSVQHRQAIEPMIVSPLADLELGGPGAEQGACSQDGSIPVTGSATGSAISWVSERKPTP